MPAAVRFYIVLYLRRLLKHRGKLRLLRLVKAVVAHAEYAKVPLQQGYNVAEVSFPVAAGAGQQQKYRGVFIPEWVYLHLPTPLR